jgi:serine/threonine protein phosphatase PrpC
MEEYDIKDLSGGYIKELKEPKKKQHQNVYSWSLQGKRPANEDQHIHVINLDGSDSNMNNINFFGVFDGHGGKLVSKYLKDNMCPYFIKKFNKNIYVDSQTAMKYFTTVFDKVQNQMKKDHPRAIQYCGSTACIAIHYKDDEMKDRLWVVNVGDSRAVKCNKSNIAEQLTQDHKPNSPEEKARIEQMGGVIEFDGVDWRVKDLSLSRALGDLECTPYVTHLPQIYRYKISRSDQYIVFACDGLWDVLSNQDVVDFVNELRGNKKFKGNYAKELAEHAINKGSLDNVTVIVYMLE